MDRKKLMSRGFTLIELLIVIAIIAVLAAIAIPQLLKSKAAANEKAVVSTMKAAVNAQALHHTERNAFGTVVQLRDRGYVDVGSTVSETSGAPGTTGTFSKSGFEWESLVPPSRQAWSLRSRPTEVGSTGNNCYFVNETSVIRLAAGSGTTFAAGPTSPALP